MKDQIQLTASKMNRVRYLFAKKYNKLFEIKEKAEYEAQQNPINLLTPILTNLYKAELIKNLNIMKHKSTELVGFILSNFIASEKCALKDTFGHTKTRRFSKGIIELLEASFFTNEYPSDNEKQAIANICKITTKQVNNWFTNKRNRAKNSRSGCKRNN